MIAATAPAQAQRHAAPWHPGQPHGQAQHPRASEVPMRTERHGYHAPRGPAWRGQPGRRHGAQAQPPRAQAIRPGTSARQYQRVVPRYGHRLGHPPRGHHYRNIGGTVVLVDDRSLQVVAIIGLLAALLG